MNKDKDTLIDAFSQRWDLLAVYHTDNTENTYFIPVRSASCTSYFFAPRRDWFEYSFSTQNMNYQCNLILQIEHISSITMENIEYSYFRIVTHDISLTLPDGYSQSGEIEASLFLPVILEKLLFGQLRIAPSSKLDLDICGRFPPNRLFPSCAINFWQKIGRKCFSPYLKPIFIPIDIFCGDPSLCHHCDRSHAPAVLNLNSGIGSYFHPNNPPCKICNKYHYPYKIIVDEYCHLSVKYRSENTIGYHD